MLLLQDTQIKGFKTLSAYMKGYWKAFENNYRILTRTITKNDSIYWRNKSPKMGSKNLLEIQMDQYWIKVYIYLHGCEWLDYSGMSVCEINGLIKTLLI